MKLIIGCILLVVIFFISCAPFRNSPFSNQLFHVERDINPTSIQRINNIEADGKIRIAIYTDPHQNYRDTDGLVVQINKATDIDFVASLGDVTNSGYNFEYDQYLDAYTLFNYPTLSVLGNHDAVGAGVEIFKKVFGPTNFWFESDTKRYIFFNSANWEAPKEFNSAWLKKTVEESTKSVLIFTHVGLRDTERFSGTDAQNFSDVISSPKVQMVLNGHNHVYNLGTDNGTVMLQAPRVEGVQWLIIEIQGNQVTITKQYTGETVSEILK